MKGKTEAVMQQSQSIGYLVEQLNDCWINGRLGDLPMYFHRDAVEISPGTTRKIVGRKEIIDNYRDFVEVFTVKNFEITDIVIDVFDSTAVVLYSFRILYQMEGTKYNEERKEVLVLNRAEDQDQWLVVWRTQMMAA